jgi:hypothetical protein
MMVDQAFSKLIGRIYECALDNSHWPAVLGEVCDVLDARFGDLSVIDGVGGALQVHVVHGWQPEHIEHLVRHSHLNPAAPLGLIHPLGEPWCGSRAMEVEQFRQTFYWKACMDGLGTLDLLAVPITPKVTRFGVWKVTGTEARGVFSDEDIDFARTITPHVRRTVEISGLIQERSAVERTLR